MGMELIKPLLPGVGLTVYYQAVGQTDGRKGPFTVRGPMHYRTSFAAEEDARQMIRDGYERVYVEQHVNGECVGRWEETDATGMDKNCLSGTEAKRVI